MEEIVKLIIVSHKRADQVKTVKAFANTCISVAESQVPEYEKFNPGIPIIAHPDSVIGLAAKYIHLHKEYGDIAILGDDIDYLRRNYSPDFKAAAGVIDPQTAYDIIQATAFTARDMGAKLFAFGKESNPLTYSGHKPFRLTGIASGGMIGLFRDFQMEISMKCVAGLDYFLSGINAYYNRFLFVDERYFTSCKEGTFISKGGMSDYRTLDTEKRDLDLLVEMFGQAIVIKHNDNLRKLKHQFEKSLRIPF